MTAARELTAGDIVLLGGTEATVLEVQLVHEWNDGPAIPSAARVFITIEKTHTQRRPRPRRVLELGLMDTITRKE